MSLLKYLRAAYLNRWNQLAFYGGIGFAFVSRRPDVVLPIVAAIELGYLTMLGSHPKFQRAIDAQDAAEEREKYSQTANTVLTRILKQLPGPVIVRYDRLKARCVELRQISADLHQTGMLETGQPMESVQLAGLDRLLWIFLRLLFTQFSLHKFLEKTKREQIVADINQAAGKLAEISEDDQTTHAQKMRHSLQDNVKTCEERLANYDRAVANYEFVGQELDRLENKIKSLAEIGVNRQEPDFMSIQVDGVANSMLETERTLNELQFATGLEPLNEETPQLLGVSDRRVFEET